MRLTGEIESSAISKTTWEISAENGVDSFPGLPENALAAQERFKKESTRCFILYGRDRYDCGITPNSDMQIKIDVSISLESLVPTKARDVAIITLVLFQAADHG